MVVFISSSFFTLGFLSGDKVVFGEFGTVASAQLTGRGVGRKGVRNFGSHEVVRLALRGMIQRH